MRTPRAPASSRITSSNYFTSEIARERQVWENKTALRRLYERWFARVAAHLPQQQPIVELGCGVGGFREFRPGIVCTDLVRSPWVDQVVDATALPFRDASLGALLGFDLLHHIPEPLRLFREAARTLRAGGRLLFVEPMITPWASLVWKLFHHEPVDLAYDPFAPPPVPPGGYFANTALPFLLFVRHAERLQREVPQLRIRALEFSDFLVYPLTGGFSRFCLLPAFAVQPLHRAETVLLRPVARRWTAMRILAVLEKVGS